MKRNSLLMAAGIVATACAMASAQSSYFLDIRDNVVGSGPAGSSTQGRGISSPGPAPTFPFTVGQGLNFGATALPNDGLAGGGKGNGQIMRISPTLSNHANDTTTATTFGNSWPNFDGDGNASTADFWLYADIGADDAGTNGVISSIGVDIAIDTPTATSKYIIGSAAWSWTLTDPSSPVNYGFANGAPQGPGGSAGVTGVKYVKVPVNGSSLYATAGGLVSSADIYRLGRLRVTAAARNGNGAAACTPNTSGPHIVQSTYNVKMNVNNLLITRTYSTVTNPALVDETVQFGYAGGALDASTNGSTAGAAPGIRDGIIQVRMKGDLNGNGNVDNGDTGLMSALISTNQTAMTQTQRYCGDFNGQQTAGLPVTPADIGAYSALFTALAPNGAGLCP